VILWDNNNDKLEKEGSVAVEGGLLAHTSFTSRINLENISCPMWQ